MFSTEMSKIETQLIETIFILKYGMGLISENHPFIREEASKIDIISAQLNTIETQLIRSQRPPSPSLFLAVGPSIVKLKIFAAQLNYPDLTFKFGMGNWRDIPV